MATMQCNGLVAKWIFNSVSFETRPNILYAKTA